MADHTVHSDHHANKPADKRSPEEAAAIHEAGHAVTAILLGLPFERATTVPESKRSLLDELKSRRPRFLDWVAGPQGPEFDRERNAWARAELMTLLAGAAAEAPGHEEQARTPQDKEALAQVEFLLWGEDDERRARGLAQLHAETRRLVAAAAPAIRALALALLARTEIHRPDIDRIIDEIPPRFPRQSLPCKHHKTDSEADRTNKAPRRPRP